MDDDGPAPECLVGQRVTHVWRGFGTALFLEFGALRPTTRRDGSPGQPSGERSLMIEWGWRIEGRRMILAGSDDEDRIQRRATAVLAGREVVAVARLGRIAELDLALVGDGGVRTFAARRGRPAWAVLDTRGPAPVEAGHRPPSLA